MNVHCPFSSQMGSFSPMHFRVSAVKSSPGFSLAFILNRVPGPLRRARKPSGVFRTTTQKSMVACALVASAAVQTASKSALFIMGWPHQASRGISVLAGALFFSTLPARTTPRSARQAPLHRLRPAGIGAGSDDAEIGAHLLSSAHGGRGTIPLPDSDGV